MTESSLPNTPGSTSEHTALSGHEAGYERLWHHLRYEIEAAQNRAVTADRLTLDPVLEAILLTRGCYTDTDPETAQHLMRMAAMRARFPYTESQLDALEAMVGIDGVSELVAARTELDALPSDVSDLNFSGSYFDAYADLGIVTGSAPWPQV